MEGLTCVDLQNINESIGKRLLRHSNKLKSVQTGNYQLSFMSEIQNIYGEKLLRVDGNIPLDLPVHKGDSFLFISYNQSKHLHNIHKYPAKYFPELPRWLIEKYTKPDDIVLDPFAGSGTTNLEALLSHRHSVAVDIEEFCQLLIKVKTTPINTEALTQSNERLISRLSHYSKDKLDVKYIPGFPYRDVWFKDYIIAELAYIRQCIIENNQSKDIADFHQICLSSIIRSVSNADDNCTRTVVRKNREKNIYPFMAISRFIELLLLNTHKMSEFTSEGIREQYKPEIPKDSDALNIQYPDNYFDIAITSPPYVNAVDYPRTHQLELYWLGLESGSLLHLKQKHVGTESVIAKDYSELKSFGIQEIDAVLAKIYETDPRRSYIAFKYLKDMQANLLEVQRVLKKDSKYIVVVGNNRIRNTLFETWKYLILIAERLGYTTETWFASEIIKHFIKVPRTERINRDYIIVLKKG